MKCEACQSLLEEYFDGELASRRSAAVREHLADCPGCAANLAELRQEHDMYARYERDLEVTPALWSNIESRIRLEKASVQVLPPVPRWRTRLSGLFAAPHISPAFAVALVLLAIGTTVVVMSYLHSRDLRSRDHVATAAEPGNPPASTDGSTTGGVKKEGNSVIPHGSATDSGGESKVEPKHPQLAANPKRQTPPDPMKLVQQAEQKYLAAIAILSRDVNRQRSQIDPGILARFDTALFEIDRTIEETRQIVRRNPGDPVALQYLLGAYAKKVDTLRAMTLD